MKGTSEGDPTEVSSEIAPSSDPAPTLSPLVDPRCVRGLVVTPGSLRPPPVAVNGVPSETAAGRNAGGPSPHVQEVEDQGLEGVPRALVGVGGSATDDVVRLTVRCPTPVARVPVRQGDPGRSPGRPSTTYRLTLAPPTEGPDTPEDEEV